MLFGGNRPAAKNSIGALFLVGASQTRPRTFQTQPGAFRRRLLRSLRGRGEDTRFPPFHTGALCRSVPVLGDPQNGQHPAVGYGVTLQTRGRAKWCALFRNVFEMHQSQKTRSKPYPTWHISITTWYIWQAIDHLFEKLGPKETLPALEYGGTLQTRSGGGRGRPRAENPFAPWYP